MHTMHILQKAAESNKRRAAISVLIWEKSKSDCLFICLLSYFAEITGNNINPVLIKKKKKKEKKRQEKKRKNRENTGKHLSDFQYECLCFHFFPYVGLIYSFVQYVFSLKRVTSWLLIVAILFDKTQVFFYFPTAHILFLSFLYGKLSVWILLTYLLLNSLTHLCLVSFQS